MNKVIYVVTHKNYKMPDDNLYQAISVGPKKNELTISNVRDDTEENI